MCVKCVDMRIKWANIRGGSQMKQVWGGIREGDVERKSAKEGSKWKWREGKYKVESYSLSVCFHFLLWLDFVAIVNFCIIRIISWVAHNNSYNMKLIICLSMRSHRIFPVLTSTLLYVSICNLGWIRPGAKNTCWEKQIKCLQTLFISDID